MSVAYVRSSDGTGALVQNTFLDSAGALHTLATLYVSSDNIGYEVFFDYLPTTIPKGRGRKFRALDSRIFIATDQRTFNV